MSTPTAIYLNLGPYLEVISGISTVFSFSDGVVKLTGPLGAGKTSLLKELFKELRNEEFETVLFPAPPKSMEELQSTLIRQFRLGADVSFRKALIRYLATKPRDMQKLILVIDDADQMTVETLSALHTLREGDQNSQIAISLILCGDNNLNVILAKPELAALSGEITLNYSLNPLDEADISEFCSSYLQQTGKGRILLSYQYLETLLQTSRGLPGQILGTLLSDMEDPGFLETNTRTEAQSEQKPAITNVISNISDQIGNIPPETKRWLVPTFNGLLVVAAASTVYVYYPRVMSIYQDLTGSNNTGGETPAVANNKPAETPAAAPVAAPAPASQQVAATTPPPAQTPVPPAPTTAPAPAPAPTQTAAVAPAPAAPKTGPAPAATRLATVPTAVTPLPPVVASSASELSAVVNDWIAAWQRQDTQAYFADYHTDFASLYHDSRASWRADRTRSLTKPAKIALSMSDFEVTGTDATGTTVRFWLNYQSPTYADRTQKELVLGQDVDGKLRILRELNREVEVQTGGRLPASSIATTTGQPPAPAIASVTPIGDPIVIQPDATVSPSTGGRDSLNRFVTSWLNAWQHKDLANYFEHYAPDFKNGPATTEAWREDRTVKITRPAVIQLQLDNMELVKEGNGETVLKLTVTYHSSFYADRTQKELHLQLNQNGGLQIVEEKNIAVEALPLSRLLPSVQVAMQELARSLASNHL